MMTEEHSTDTEYSVSQNPSQISEMAKRIYLCVICFFVFLSFAAISFTVVLCFQEDGATAFMEAIIAVEPDVYDFGDIDNGIYTAVIKLTNRSNTIIRTFHVISSCTCTRVNLPRVELQPGMSTNMEIIFDTEKRHGIIGGYVMIAFVQDNDPAKITRYAVANFRANVE